MNKHFTKQELVQMGVDLSQGRLYNFSLDQVNERYRQALLAVSVGGNVDFEKLNWRDKVKAVDMSFQIIEEVLPIVLTEGIKSQWDMLVDTRNTNFGDRPVWMIEDYHLFNVSTVAAGTNNARRQRQDRKELFVPTVWKEIKVYEEMERFLAGKVDWNRVIDKVMRSMEASIKGDIYQAIVAAYSGLNTPYKEVGVFDRTRFNTLVQHVQAITNSDVMVFGTKLALQKTQPAFVSYKMMDEYNEKGFFRLVDGTEMFEIPQAIRPGTDDFAIGNDFLIVVPKSDEKIIKLLFEGQPMIRQTSGTSTDFNMDDTIEFTYKQKYGVGLVTSTRFGAYVFA